jgi:hypothetical protein
MYVAALTILRPQLQKIAAVANDLGIKPMQ